MDGLFRVYNTSIAYNTFIILKRVEKKEDLYSATSSEQRLFRRCARFLITIYNMSCRIPSSSNLKAASSTDDSDDDEATMKMLREATDQTLLTNDMFTDQISSTTKTNNGTGPRNASSSVKQTLASLSSVSGGRRSQRYLDTDERLENDMQITESMQNFMHKKLNQLLEQRIEFVEIEEDQPAAATSAAGDDPSKADENVDVSVVRLFRDSEPIVLCDTTANYEASSNHRRQKKAYIKKRRLPEEMDTDIDKAAKMQASLCTLDDINTEINGWKKAPKAHKLYNYREHRVSKQLYLVEPDTEFTAQRKKHNWSESKIARKWQTFESRIKANKTKA